MSDDVKGDALTLHEAIMEINNAILSEVVKYIFKFKCILLLKCNILGYELFHQEPIK